MLTLSCRAGKADSLHRCQSHVQQSALRNELRVIQGLVTPTCQRDCFAEDIDKRERFSITKPADKPQMKIYDVQINRETLINF